MHCAVGRDAVQQTGIGTGNEDVAIGLGIRTFHDHIGGKFGRQLLLRDADPYIVKYAPEGPARYFAGVAEILDLLRCLDAAQLLHHALGGNQLDVYELSQLAIFAKAENVTLKGERFDIVFFYDRSQGFYHAAADCAPIHKGEVRSLDLGLLGIAGISDQETTVCRNHHTSICALKAADPTNVRLLLQK